MEYHTYMYQFIAHTVVMLWFPNISPWDLTFRRLFCVSNLGGSYSEGLIRRDLFSEFYGIPIAGIGEYIVSKLDQYFPRNMDLALKFNSILVISYPNACPIVSSILDSIPYPLIWTHSHFCLTVIIGTV